MGDRFDRLGVRHANVEALLRRPGIGHNNGPTFDMSWEAWAWRRATAKAAKTPKPEVAMMPLKRAERLGPRRPRHPQDAQGQRPAAPGSLPGRRRHGSSGAGGGRRPAAHQGHREL